MKVPGLHAYPSIAVVKYVVCDRSAIDTVRGHMGRDVFSGKAEPAVSVGVGVAGPVPAPLLGRTPRHVGSKGLCFGDSVSPQEPTCRGRSKPPLSRIVRIAHPSCAGWVVTVMNRALHLSKCTATRRDSI